MPQSPLQDIFLENLVEIMRSSRQRVLSRANFLTKSDQTKVDQIVWWEILGIVHGILCEFDGATSLADHGLISITDEDNNPFDKYIHELLFEKLNQDELQEPNFLSNPD